MDIQKKDRGAPPAGASTSTSVNLGRCRRHRRQSRAESGPRPYLTADEAAAAGGAGGHRRGGVQLTLKADGTRRNGEKMGTKW